uniref:Capsid protein n=1 Tax=Phytophthora palustris toti-like virus 7 TaxID=2976319 RepID=A0A9E9BXC9_9VIRU|nr:capsid protein [Phytophthora palustris toti-like virus 7]
MALYSNDITRYYSNAVLRSAATTGYMRDTPFITTTGQCPHCRQDNHYLCLALSAHQAPVWPGTCNDADPHDWYIASPGNPHQSPLATNTWAVRPAASISHGGSTAVYDPAPPAGSYPQLWFKNPQPLSLQGVRTNSQLDLATGGRYSMTVTDKLNFQEITVPDTGVTYETEKPDDATEIALPDGIIPNHFGATVSLEANTTLLKNYHTVRESHRIGKLWQPLSNVRVSWPGTTSTAVQTVKLAPAFASLATDWLDKGVLAAMGSVASWLATVKNVELDIRTRSAIRQCANTPIELTRLYIRLWALWLDANIASLEQQSFAPVVTNDLDFSVRQVTSATQWYSAVKYAHTTAATSLFFDGNATVMAPDIVYVLMVALSASVDEARCSSWLWPTLGKTMFCHNMNIQVTPGSEITPSMVMGAITWLVGTSSTIDQAIDAKNFVMMSAYRPEGVGLAGGSTAAKHIVALPSSNSIGMMLGPMTLNATSMQVADSELPTPESPLKCAIAASLRGMVYLATLGMAVSRFITPNYELSDVKRLNADLERSALSTMNARTRLSTYAAQLRRMFKLSLQTRYSSSITLADTRIMRTQRYHDNTNASQLLYMRPTIYDISADTARYFKWKYAEQPRIICGRWLSLQATGIDNASAHLANLVQEVGGTVALTTYDMLSHVIYERQPVTATINPGFQRPDVDSDNMRKYTYSAYFHSPAQWHEMRRRLECRNQHTWHIDRSAYSTDVGAEFQEMWLSLDADAAKERTEPDIVDTSASPGSAVGPSSVTPPTPDSKPEMPTPHASVAHSTDDQDPTDKPPEALTKLAEDDRVVRALILSAKDKIQDYISFKSNMSGSVKDWSVPDTIARDKASLQWLLNATNKVHEAIPTAAAALTVEELRGKLSVAILNSATDELVSGVTSLEPDDLPTAEDIITASGLEDKPMEGTPAQNFPEAGHGHSSEPVPATQETRGGTQSNQPSAAAVEPEPVLSMTASTS